ncbi:MAG: hypothetical protein ACRC0S_08330 [Fusobacteriaceae bacterium]
MKKYYAYEELKRETYYELYKICVDEKLVEGFQENLDRIELINIILKYRSKEKNYAIEDYKTEGIDRIQDVFDTKLGFKLNESDKIKIPHKIVLYKEMDLTEEDGYKLTIPEHVSTCNVFLINGNNYLCGIFQLELSNYEKDVYLFKGKEHFFRISDLKNQKYSLRFFNRVDEKYIFNIYSDDLPNTVTPYKLDYYEVPLDSFQHLSLEKTETVLCIDFGTANTTAGAYLDRYYVNNVPQNRVLSEEIQLDKINYIKFKDGEKDYKNVVPTLIYIKKIISEDNIEYIFGNEVEKNLKANNYTLKGSIFYSIKNWMKSATEKERIVDENGNIAFIERKAMIKAYISFIIHRAEFLFKCKFQNIHISTPVKLKVEFLNVFQLILPDYKLIKENSLDEGVAVLYNSIENIIEKGRYEEDKLYKALIIDCGGGTTDLASCTFKVNNKDIYYEVDIRTTFENSEESFGGNNLTYRIMQYLKVIFSKYYTEGKFDDINTIIKNSNDLIYRDIDEHGIESIYKELEEKYIKAEEIIPTQFSLYENQAKDTYSKVKNNFFFMWEISELLKKEIFKKHTVVRSKFDRVNFTNNDISNTCVNSWSINILNKGKFKNINTYPSIVFNKNELIKLLKGDIYEILRSFLDPYYERGLLYEYSLIKLSGQTCKVNIFNEILKEFVPGKMIDIRRNTEEEDNQLKISCVDGAIKFLNSSKIGNIKVKIKNEIPIVPYSIYGNKHDGEEVEILKMGEKAGEGYGSIKKISSTEILPFYLKNKEQEIKKTFTYVNKKEGYTEVDELKIVEYLENKFTQNDLDDILNNEVKFFIYTDSNFWGVSVLGVKRKENQLFMGAKEYYSFEKDLTTISFFDGKH